MKIIVSSCLIGFNCKYDGGNNYNEQLVSYLKKHDVIHVCPEQLGGLSTPRKASEIKDGKVYHNNGSDVSEEFKKGALETLKIAKDNNCFISILKKNSPSCGFCGVYDGTFSHKLIPNNGITADLLYKNGIVVLNEDNYHLLKRK